MRLYAIPTNAATKNYTPANDDLGKYLIFEVVPVASSGESVGSLVQAVIGRIAESGADG